MAWSLLNPEHVWVLNLKFGPNRTKNEVFLGLPCLAWASPNLADWQHSADWNSLWPRKTLILVRFGSNFEFRAYWWVGLHNFHASLFFQLVKRPNVESLTFCIKINILKRNVAILYTLHFKMKKLLTNSSKKYEVV